MAVSDFEAGLMASIDGQDSGVKQADVAREKMLGVYLNNPQMAEAVSDLQRAVKNQETVSPELLQKVAKSFGVTLDEGLPKRKKSGPHKNKSPYGYDLSIQGAVEHGLLSGSVAKLFSGEVGTLQGVREVIDPQVIEAKIFGEDELTLSDVEPFMDEVTYLALREVCPTDMSAKSLLHASRGYARLSSGQQQLRADFEGATNVSMSVVYDNVNDAVIQARTIRSDLVNGVVSSVEDAAQKFLGDVVNGDADKYGEALSRPRLKR